MHFGCQRNSEFTALEKDKWIVYSHLREPAYQGDLGLGIDRRSATVFTGITQGIGFAIGESGNRGWIRLFGPADLPQTGNFMNVLSSILAFGAVVGVLGGLAGQPGGNPSPVATPATPAAAKPPVPSGHPQIPLPTVAANWPKAKPEDVKSVEAIMAAFYAVPAGAAGEARDWDRYRSLFVPEARMIPARSGPDGAAGTIFLPITEYIDANKVYFEKGGFRDTEVSRRVEEFGNMVSVWSTFESRRNATDPKPYIRGINSIQLLKDGSRYWVVNVYWDFERPGNELPEKYLTKTKE